MEENEIIDAIQEIVAASTEDIIAKIIHTGRDLSNDEFGSSDISVTFICMLFKALATESNLFITEASLLEKGMKEAITSSILLTMTSELTKNVSISKPSSSTLN